MAVIAWGSTGTDFAGIWTGVMADRNGDLQDLSFRFEQHEGVLTGKMYGDNESVAITDGKVDGNQIRFVVTTELNGSIARTLFTGTLGEGQIQMKRGRADALPPAAAGAKSPEKPPERPNGKQTFVLKRL